MRHESERAAIGGCDYVLYPNYGPLSRGCRQHGALRSCGHSLCDKHASRHESVCRPPAAHVVAAEKALNPMRVRASG
jgi:hypothetical protein